MRARSNDAKRDNVKKLRALFSFRSWRDSAAGGEMSPRMRDGQRSLAFLSTPSFMQEAKRSRAAQPEIEGGVWRADVLHTRIGRFMGTGLREYRLMDKTPSGLLASNF